MKKERETIIMAISILAIFVSGTYCNSQEIHPPDMEIEVRTPLIEKYLPEHHVIAKLHGQDGQGDRCIIIRHKNNSKSIFLDESWSAKTSESAYRVRSVSEFIASLNIQICDEQTAIEIAQLIEDITRSPNAVQCLMYNENNYHLFDNKIYTSNEDERKNWEYTAKLNNNIWIVMVSYIGPPVSIMEPPIYEIELTKDQRFKEIRILKKE